MREQLEEKLNSRYPVLKSDNGLLNDVIKALVCGFYMQAAVRNSRNGNYIRVNDGMVIVSYVTMVELSVVDRRELGGETSSQKWAAWGMCAQVDHLQ